MKTEGRNAVIELLKTGKTIDKIMNASVEELCEVEGIGEGLAEKIKTYFKENI